jgi:hypothetical protein
VDFAGKFDAPFAFVVDAFWPEYPRLKDPSEKDPRENASVNAAASKLRVNAGIMRGPPFCHHDNPNSEWRAVKQHNAGQE